MTQTIAKQPVVPAPPDEPPGIYVHIPFCTYICPYCDFNTYAGHEDLVPAYVDAVIGEMRLIHGRTEDHAPAPSLFFGGGTPTLLPAAQLGRIIEVASDLFGIAADSEISIEANPERLTVDYLRDLRRAGVNRISLGVQSQQRAGLKVLGRIHDPAEAWNTYRAARTAGFDNVSLDFMFGWPGQAIESWERDLLVILDWEPEHVSLYSLIVEPNTPMARAVERGILEPLDDDAVADFYNQSSEVLGSAGWEHYEVANWARTPCYRSRHNQLYWRNGMYHGFGAGAHGYLGNRRWSNIRLPGRYIEAVAENRRPVATGETITPETAEGESMMLGLRLLRDGVSSSAFRARHGEQLTDVYDTQIRRFCDLGLLEWHGERLRLTQRGALVANGVSAEFLP